MPTMSTVPTSRELRTLFDKYMKEWKTQNGDKIYECLMSYGASLPGTGMTLWDGLYLQILYLAEEKNISAEKVVEELFQQKNEDAFMLYLQS